MAKLKVNVDITVMFYNAVILPIFTYGFLSNDQKCRLDKPRKICCRLVRLPHDNEVVADVFNVYKKSVQTTAKKIIDDLSHPLNKCFVSLPSRRRCNYRLPIQRTNRFRNSFVPVALRLLNDS